MPGYFCFTAGLGSLSRTIRLMVSTPPPIAASAPSATIWCAAMAMACKPDEQNRFTVIAAAETGRPAWSADTRAMLWPCTPWGWPQPRITSSISPGSSCGVLRRTSLMQWAARSSGRFMLKDPRNDFARPVRELPTTTASLMLLLWEFLRARRNSKLSRGAFLFVEVGEGASFGGQFLQQRRRLPEFSVSAVKFGDALVDFFQADGVGVPHRAAAIGWKAVAVDVDDVDVDRAQGISFLENAGAFVD